MIKDLFGKYVKKNKFYGVHFAIKLQKKIIVLKMPANFGLTFSVSSYSMGSQTKNNKVILNYTLLFCPNFG